MARLSWREELSIPVVLVQISSPNTESFRANTRWQLGEDSPVWWLQKAPHEVQSRVMVQAFGAETDLVRPTYVGD